MKNPKFFYGWYIVAACWAMVFLNGSAAVSVFFKPMLEDFGDDRAIISSVQSVATLVFVVASPLLGRLVDRFGPRTMILVCVATQVLCRLLYGVATNIWQLYLARLLFYVNPMTSSQVLINSWFNRKRGKALGIASTGVSLGTMILAPISQHLILIWDWRPTMLFWSAVALVTMLPLALSIKNNPEDKGYSPDGEPLEEAALVTPTPHKTAPLSEIRTSITIAEVAKNKAFWFLGIAQVICGFGCGFMMTHIVIFATDMGYSDMVAASLISVQGGLNLVGVLSTGYLSDKIKRSKVLALVHFIRGISFLVITCCIIIGSAPICMLYLAVALFGFGWYTTAPLSAGLAADLFGHLRIGTILGIVLSCHLLGAAVGAYAGGATFELTGSYYWFLLTQGLLEFMAATFAMSIKYLNRGSATSISQTTAN